MRNCPLVSKDDHGKWIGHAKLLLSVKDVNVKWIGYAKCTGCGDCVAGSACVGCSFGESAQTRWTEWPSFAL